jgi:hypothetical protein
MKAVLFYFILHITYTYISIKATLYNHIQRD